MARQMRKMQEVCAGQALYVGGVARDGPYREHNEGVAMIKHIHVTGVHVSDQDRALDFYTNKLGFEKRADISVGDFRWIEVVPPGAETALVLEPGQGTVGTFTSVVFVTDDIQATYDELHGRGVRFTQEPTRQDWGGIQAQFVDQDGNTFVLVQHTGG
jgi:predicted enzyme related to lactoylglutathione lyase